MTAITIVTTTFNRRDLLKRCYRSLNQQSCRDFDWLIVDDGSTDGTAEAVAEWASEATFGIRILRKHNGGKHTALNRAFPRAQGEYVLLLDSDDVLAPEAIRRVTSTLRDRRFPAGLIGNKHDFTGMRVIGRPIPPSVDRTTGRELRERFGVTGDTLRVYRSEITRELRFPEFSDERFVPENVLFDEIDANHEVAVSRDVIYLCDYQDSGLSSDIQRHRAMSPRGFAAGLESTAWISRRPRWIIEYTLKYQIWSKATLGTYGREDFRRKLPFAACLPLAAALHSAGRPRFIFEALTWRRD